LPKIPSLPISFSNAERLLEEVGGLHEGRLLSGRVSETKVKLVNHVDTKVTKIYNVMAAIPGHISDEVVMVGNHRDAWVMGASDPTSGTVSLHEVIRGFGVLLRQGWKPLRTIVFASWDAEEYSLVGSTEYGEDFGEWISSHVVAYLNVDIAVSGSRWTAGASPSLAHLIRRTAQDVPHPTKPGTTLWDARDDDGPFAGVGDEEFMASYEASLKKIQASDTGIPPLGSGSDFTIFLQHLGVASMDQGFGYTPSDAAFHYHSVYDSQRWQEQYADPGFHRHVAVAKHLGLMTLRLTDAIILPLNTTQYVLELHQYLDQVENIASSTLLNPNFSDLRKAISDLQSASVDLDEEKEEAEEAFRSLLHQLPGRHGSCPRRKFRRIADWIKRLFGVHPRHDAHHLGPNSWMDVAFSNAQLRGDYGSTWEQQHQTHHRSPHFPFRKFIRAAKRVRKANQKLIAFERGFISDDGIKDREWYKHLGVAPGLWLGYGATTFPGLTEALSIHKNATLVKFEAARLTDLIEKLAVTLRP
jgi:N-acetylated-alpha-linked acidic dipeptidase